LEDGGGGGAGEEGEGMVRPAQSHDIMQGIDVKNEEQKKKKKKKKKKRSFFS
jgi:hypothetical protein